MGETEDLTLLTDEQLRERLRRVYTPDPNESPRAAVAAWAVRFGVYPGPTLGPTSQELYRHFIQHGYALKGTKRPFWDWGRLLHELGLTKGRIKVAGRDMRSWKMAAVAARDFRVWQRCNPPAPNVDLMGMEGFRCKKELLRMGRQ